MDAPIPERDLATPHAARAEFQRRIRRQNNHGPRLLDDAVRYERRTHESVICRGPGMDSLPFDSLRADNVSSTFRIMENEARSSEEDQVRTRLDPEAMSFP